nr:MAG TPA: hypothetical protein [Caudoviricetes sp.]
MTNSSLSDIVILVRSKLIYFHLEIRNRRTARG